MKSSMKSAKRINNYEVYPKNGVAQTIMYQNMSSHYRRIYNAKPRIDTGPPFSLRPKPRVQTKNNITWSKKENEYFIPKQNDSTVSLNSSKCSRQGCVDITVPTFKPQISKTPAESKLRGLRVYHPPRRRVYSTSNTSIQLIKSSPDISVPDIPWIRGTGDVKTPSKGSSSDSAYTEEGEGLWSGGESRGHTPVSDNQRVSSSENLMYVKFVRDITEEVLEKGIFTNKALKKIFQNHVEANKKYLDMRRMQEEIEKLQLELGIPTDDSLDKMGYGVTSLSSNEKITCSKIEDKELLDALSQLNISSSLKADIASSLGLYSTSESVSLNSVSSSDESIKHSRNSKHATFSSPLEVIYDISQKEKFSRQKFPQSDDDSYEMLSEGSESRPATPLGLAW